MSKNNTITVLKTPSELRDWRIEQIRLGNTIGFVPTMGALHAGHISLVEEAKRHSSSVIVSIFVNPTQFAPHEDFDSYPRTMDEDLEKLTSAGCHAVYCPVAKDLYPEGNCTQVYVENLSKILEGEHRPHFFGGVTNIVSRLFTHVAPDIAVFGEKDYQQLQIIKRMTLDLGMQIKVIGAKTMREPDGLAMSSRNRYLSPEDREKAGKFAQALRKAAQAIENGSLISSTIDQAIQDISAAGLGPIDYVAVRDASSLEDLGTDTLKKGVDARILTAAWMGKTRLIDNLPLSRN